MNDPDLTAALAECADEVTLLRAANQQLTLPTHEGIVAALSDPERGGSEFVVRLPLAAVAFA